MAKQVYCTAHCQPGNDRVQWWTHDYNYCYSKDGAWACPSMKVEALVPKARFTVQPWSEASGWELYRANPADGTVQQLEIRPGPNDGSPGGNSGGFADLNGTLYFSGYDDANGWPAAADNGYSLILTGSNPALPASWIASLDPGGSGISSFTSWRSRYFSDASGNPDADPDADGLNNFGEYAFATDPRSPGTREASLATLIPGPTQAIAVRRRSGAPDVRWSFEYTAKPISRQWSIRPGDPESITPSKDGTETATWRGPATNAPRVFLRIRASTL
jgi:hypothetical protein